MVHNNRSILHKGTAAKACCPAPLGTGPWRPFKILQSKYPLQNENGRLVLQSIKDEIPAQQQLTIDSLFIRD